MKNRNNNPFNWSPEFTKREGVIFCVIFALLIGSFFIWLDFYRKNYYPELSRVSFYPTQFMVTLIFSLAVGFPLYLILVTIIQCVLKVMKNEKFTLNDYGSICVCVLTIFVSFFVLHLYEFYRFKNPLAFQGDYVAEKIAYFVITIFVVSIGGLFLMGYILRKIFKVDMGDGKIEG